MHIIVLVSSFKDKQDEVKMFVIYLVNDYICSYNSQIILTNLTCNTLWISIKSSVGFQRPKSLFKFFCFLDLFLLEDDVTLEVEGVILKGFTVTELIGVLLDGTFRGWVVVVNGVLAIIVSGMLWTGDMTLSISIKQIVLKFSIKNKINSKFHF